MAGSWKAFVLVFIAGFVVRAQEGISASPNSVSRVQSQPTPAATLSVVPTSAAGPQQQSDRESSPQAASGRPAPGPNGQTGSPTRNSSPQAAGGRQGAGGPDGPGGEGGAQPAYPGAGPDGKPLSPFIYMPSFSMAVAAATIYLVISFVTIVQCFKYKTWFLLLVAQAALADAVGAVARTHAVLHPKAMIFFIIQQMTFGMVPSLLGIMAIMTFTRVIWWMTPNDRMNKSILKTPPHAISLLWAGGAVVPDMVKGVASFMGKPKAEPKSESASESKEDMAAAMKNRPNPAASLFNRIQSVSLVVQFVVFACWTLWALRYMRISRRWMMSGEVIEKRGRRLGWACVLIGAVLTFRIAYATVEFDAMYNPMSFVSQHEWMYWLFDHIPVLITYIILIIHQPGKYLPRDYTRFKFDTKKIQKAKRENSLVSAVSSPIQRQDTKSYEVTAIEVAHPGTRV